MMTMMSYGFDSTGKECAQSHRSYALPLPTSVIHFRDSRKAWL